MASSTRIPYPQASRALLRDSVLDAMRDLVTEKDWSEVTMSQVATAAGVSRQTVYNEFKSRPGLAQAYALRLVDRFVEVVGAAVYRHPGSVRKALVDGFTDFFTLSAADPLVKSLLTGEAKPDLLRLITTDSAPILERGAEQLSETFRRSWIQAGPAEAGILGRGIVRLALSYISMPPAAHADVAEDLAALIGPFGEEVTGTGD